MFAAWQRADEKAGRKPDQEGGVGVEKDEAEATYTCWHDRAGNLRQTATGHGSRAGAAAH